MLPDGYERLEYLQKNDVAPKYPMSDARTITRSIGYLPLYGYGYDFNTYDIEYEYDSASGFATPLFGWYYSSSFQWYLSSANGNSSQYVVETSYSSSSNGSIAGHRDANRHIFKASKNYSYLDGDIMRNNKNAYSRADAIYIFGVRDLSSSGYTFITSQNIDYTYGVVSQKFISLKLYEAGTDNLVAHFVPVRRKSDGKLGAFNIAISNGQFYPIVNTYNGVEYDNVITAGPLYNSPDMTISFNTKDGSEIDSQVLVKGEIPNRPENPIKEGYNFEHWELGGYEYEFDTPLYNDNILVATYSEGEKPYLVQFNTKGGTPIDNQIVGYNEIPEKPEDPTKPNNDFVRWEVNGYEYNFDEPLNFVSTLVAIWEEKEPTNPQLIALSKRIPEADIITLENLLEDSKSIALNYMYPFKKDVPTELPEKYLNWQLRVCEYMYRFKDIIGLKAYEENQLRLELSSDSIPKSFMRELPSYAGTISNCECKCNVNNEETDNTEIEEDTNE